MQTMRIESSFDCWREAARGLLQQEAPPQEVLWDDGTSGQALLGAFAGAASPAGGGARTRARVPADFVEVAQEVALHREAERWALLYRVLWRLTHGEPRLMRIEVDADVHRLLLMQRQVGYDRHRMLGFVRFRVLQTPEGERYVAWYKPDHHVVRSAAGSFVSRFAVMRWSIFTPDESVHWDGRALSYSAGVAAASASEDEVENLWRCYYRASFIPARANPKAIDRHIPRRYRAAMPEGGEIPDLLAGK